MKQYITIINESIPNAEQPNLININLKDHQLKMLYKCLELERTSLKYDDETIETSFGVIGDPVGSGKSYIILALIASEYKTYDKINFISKTSLFQIYNYKCPSNINCDILVIPYNLITQWKSYIKNIKLKVSYITQSKHLENIDFESNLIVISSSFYNKFCNQIDHNLIFNRVIFDEADSIRIPNCEKIPAHFYWFVSSSIHNLLNPCSRSFLSTSNYHINGIKHNGFIKYAFVQIEGLHKYTKPLFLKNSDKLIKKSFLLPEPILHKKLCKNLNIINVLSDYISDNIKKMIFAGNIEEAIKHINIQQSNEHNIIKLVANDILREIDNKNLELEYTMRKNYIIESKREEDIQKIKTEIDNLNNKIKDIKNRMKENNIDPITYEEIQNLVIVNCCKQNFDFESITKYISSVSAPKCPMCRAKLSKNNLILINNNIEIIEDINEINDKPDELNKILTLIQSNARILIFSEFSNTWNIISNILIDNNIEYKELKGNNYIITNILNWYKNDDNKIKVLLLNAKYYGSGLNLENTTDVIIYHKMDIDLEKQVIGRAQRVGRQNALNIWKLLYENEE